MKRLYALAIGLAACASISAQTTDDIKVIYDTDFTIFTDGSEANPTTDLTPSLYSGDLYTKTQWRGSKVKSAGGAIWIADGGYIESYYLSGTSATTPIKITIVTRSGSEYGGAIQLTGIGTTSITEIFEDDQYTTISIVTTGARSTSRLKIAPFLSAEGMFVKSVKIESSTSFLVAPTAGQPSQADGTSFTATWKSVTGATGYQLDVYSYTSTGEKEYFLKSQEVTGTSYKVTGLDPETTYYYVVRTVKDSNVSDNSNEIEVVKVIASIDAPTGLSATEVSENGFTARWNAVPDAIGYIVTYVETIETTETGSVSVFSEDFSGVTIGTFNSVSFSGNLNDFTKQDGWITDYSYAYAAGNYVISPYGENNSVITPQIDLSANNGALEVAMTLAEANFGRYYSGGKVTVAVLDEDAETVISSDEITIDEQAYKNYTFNLTGGKAASRIKITYDGSNKLFIDDITVSQTLPAGSKVQQTVEVAQTEECTYTFNHPATDGAERSFYVYAVARTVANGEITTIQSAASESCNVDGNSGVEETVMGADAAKAWKSGINEVTVNGDNTVIYDLNGRVIASATGSATIAINVKGIVIVVVDGTATKLAF